METFLSASEVLFGMIFQELKGETKTDPGQIILRKGV
jgi:hypothetical protein